MNQFLEEKILNNYNDEILSIYKEAINNKRYTTIRINNLTTCTEEVIKILDENGIKYKEVPWYPSAYIILNKTENYLTKLNIYEDGAFYLQNLSSQIPPLYLEPKSNELILDMAASPGGKTSEICALSNNTCLVTAIEKNKIRYERLKYNLNKLGTKKVNVLNIDARNLDEFFMFDKILLDAPCSGSGTLNKETINNFNEELLNRSIKTQYELLNEAIKHLNVNGTLIYSTCSILELENENIVKRILKENDNVVLEPITPFEGLPILNNKLPGTITVCPNEYYEGFFIAKLKRIK